MGSGFGYLLRQWSCHLTRPSLCCFLRNYHVWFVFVVLFSIFVGFDIFLYMYNLPFDVAGEGVKSITSKVRNPGSVDKFIDDLPGVPDNIHYDGQGLYWIALNTVLANYFC